MPQFLPLYSRNNNQIIVRINDIFVWNHYHNVWYLRSLIYVSYSLLIIIFIHNMSTYVVWLLLENVSPHIKNIPLSSTKHKMRIKLSIINNRICNYFIKVICTESNKEEIISPLLQIQKPSFQEGMLFKPRSSASKIQVLSILLCDLISMRAAKKN